MAIIFALISTPGLNIAVEQVPVLAASAVDAASNSFGGLNMLFRWLVGAKPAPVRQESLSDRIGRVTSIRVSPARFVSYIGDKQTFTAVGADSSGEVVHGVRFEWASPDTRGVQIDEAGHATFLQPGLYNIRCRAGSFSSGRAAVRSESGKWGFIDKHGVIIVAPRFDSVHEFREGLASVQLDRKWGFIDTNGKMVIEPQFEYAGSFSEGLAHIARQGKWGFVDRSGEVVIPLAFDQVQQFSEGLAAFRLDSRFGFVDRHGRVAIPAKFNGHIVGFTSGVARIDGPDGGYIDKTGRYVWKDE